MYQVFNAYRFKVNKIQLLLIRRLLKKKKILDLMGKTIFCFCYVYLFDSSEIKNKTYIIDFEMFMTTDMRR